MPGTPTLLSSAVLLILPLSPLAASAEVVSISASGFVVRNTAEIAAVPDKVYAALIKPADWWSSDHTFSHSPRMYRSNSGSCPPA